MGVPNGISRERFEENEKTKSRIPDWPFQWIAEEVIKDLINSLLTTLFEPAPEGHWQLSHELAGKYNLLEDSVNWGDISCISVEKGVAYLEEASPDDSNGLCTWLEKVLREWGWEIRVETEW